jgi:hypothetical protein
MPETTQIQQQHMLARQSLMGIRKSIPCTVAELFPARKGFIDGIRVPDTAFTFHKTSSASSEFRQSALNGRFQRTLRTRLFQVGKRESTTS